MNIEFLNEVFDTTDLEGYSSTDIWPATKTPQCFLIKGPGIGNLVVRLGALVDGSKVRNLQVADKDVAVFIMSMSEKGNLTEFKGNLGSNPIKTIIQLFNTVMDAISLTKVETVLFRFPNKAIKGQNNQIKRIIDRLLIAKAKGRMVTLDELMQYNKKFSFIMAHKKNIKVTDLPGAEVNPERFTKVDTKVGEIYVDVDSGKETSVADAVSETIATKLDKITTASVISKTKLDRRIVAAAQYSAQEFNSHISAKSKEAYSQLMSDVPVYEASGEKSKVAQSIDSLDMKDIYSGYSNYESSENQEGYSSQRATHEKVYGAMIKSGVQREVATSSAVEVVRHIGTIMQAANPRDLQSAYVKVANYIYRDGPTRSMEESVKLLLLKRVISTDLNRELFGDALSKVMGTDEAHEDNVRRFSEEEFNAISAYTGQSYEVINDTLLGKLPSLNEKVLDLIKTLDGAFAKGTTLDKGVLLYRGQKLKFGLFEPIVNAKLMYFRNFVSASLYPIIYGGYASAGEALPDNAEDVTDLSFNDYIKSPALNKFDIANAQDDPEYVKKRKSVSLGIVIKGGHKIKTITPGKISKYLSECEVILPRGTMIKIDKITASLAEDDMDNTALIESTIIGPEQFDESVDVYDGDKFLTEGVLEKLKPSLFESMYAKASDVNYTLNEEVIPEDPEVAQALASCVNLDGISDKFTS